MAAVQAGEVHATSPQFVGDLCRKYHPNEIKLASGFIGGGFIGNIRFLIFNVV